MKNNENILNGRPLIEKVDVIETLVLNRNALNRIGDIKGVEAIDKCLNDIESIKEYVPKFYVVDKGGK